MFSDVSFRTYCTPMKPVAYKSKKNKKGGEINKSTEEGMGVV